MNTNPTPPSEIRDQQREVMPEEVARQLQLDGWEMPQSDRFRKAVGEIEIYMRLSDQQAWVVTVETNGEVMRLPFTGASFGQAVTEANRLFNLTSENQDRVNRENEERKRLEREHYGTETPDAMP